MSIVALCGLSRSDGPHSDDEEDSPYNEGDAMLDEYEREERKNPREIPISEVRIAHLTRITSD